MPGFLLSLLGLATSYLLEHFAWLNRPIVAADRGAEVSEQQARLARKQSWHILLVVIGLILSVLGLDIFSVGTGTGRILLAGLAVAGVWLLYYRNHSAFLSTFRRFWDSGVIKAADMAVLFIAMGLFAGAVDHSGLLTSFQPTLQAVANQSGRFSLVAVLFGYIALAVAGIHPFILVVILGKILMSLSLQLAPISIALLLLVASGVSFIVSPFAGMILMTAKFLNVKPVEVAWKWNVVYCLLFLTEGLLFAFVWK